VLSKNVGSVCRLEREDKRWEMMKKNEKLESVSLGNCQEKGFTVQVG
jgi:hypothetical protein